MSIQGYFFYSQKQQDNKKHYGKRGDAYAKLDNGEIVLYTQMRDTNEPLGNLDDYVYLGHGEFHHRENK